MSALYQIPAFFLTALCHVIVIYYMAEHKYSRKKFLFYGGVYIAGFVGAGVLGFATGGMVMLFAYAGIVVGLFLFSCTVSKDCFAKKCFLFITYFCLFSVFDNMLKLMIQLLLPEMPEMAKYYAAILLRCLILMLILALYKKYAVAIFRSFADSNARWWNLAMIALLFYLLQASVSIFNVEGTVPDVYLFLGFAAISLVMCVVYGVVFSNINYMKKDAEAALVRQNAEYLSNRLAVLQNAEETYRRLRHDMRHHLDMIAEYAKTGDTSAILTYIGEYSVEISETAVRQYSRNGTVNSLLSVYAKKAEESGIDFSVRCNVPKELKAREIDVVALLGNLLENALHGCRESGKENPRIDLYIRLKNRMLLIVCDNTCSEELKLSDNLPVGKSIGISSVLDVCRKYDGNLDYKIKNDICSFHAVLNL